MVAQLPRTVRFKKGLPGLFGAPPRVGCVHQGQIQDLQSLPMSALNGSQTKAWVGI